MIQHTDSATLRPICHLGIWSVAFDEANMVSWTDGTAGTRTQCQVAVKDTSISYDGHRILTSWTQVMRR